MTMKKYMFIAFSHFHCSYALNVCHCVCSLCVVENVFMRILKDNSIVYRSSMGIDHKMIEGSSATVILRVSWNSGSLPHRDEDDIWC